ncbi:MAG TPA: hypothetical protein VGQ28_08415, partial [Thermoanaerobaculia bacterium]|nr:hypothetical protein [Thermoanaerobaculia bacterium]
MRLQSIPYSRPLAFVCLIALCAAPVQGQARVSGGPAVALARIASSRIESVPGADPRYLDRPTVLPAGRLFALRMPDRKLVSLETRGGSLSIQEMALPTSVYVPLAMAADGAGRLLVLDPSIRRVLRFVVTGSGPQAAGSFAVEEGGVDLCAMNGRIYVYRPAAAHPITVYTEAGVSTGTFGQQFGSGSARRREMMSAGHLLCAGPDRRLLVASNLTGEIQSYAENGRMLWAR